MGPFDKPDWLNTWGEAGEKMKDQSNAYCRIHSADHPAFTQVKSGKKNCPGRALPQPH